MSEPVAPRPTPSADFFEFGPFRLEAATRSLYRGSEFVALTPKALEVLSVLVEEAGRVVTKEELLQRVWRDAFVEEGSITNNISSLRKILNPYFEGDDPIATVSRVGYRFTVPVTLRNATATIALVADSGPLDTVAQSAVAASDHELATVKVDRFNSRGIAASVFVIVAVIGVANAMRSVGSEDAGPIGVRRAVAVLPMKNLSADPAQGWLAIALAETISAELAGGNNFRVVFDENVARMQQEPAPPGVGFSRKQLDDIGRDLACDMILTGNFLVSGDRLRVDVRLEEVATGEVMASASVTDDATRLLDIVIRAGSELRSALGIDQPAQARAAAMRAAFSVNPDALRNYFQGLEALRLRDGPRARDFFTASIAADGNFALAHSAMSTTWRLLGYDTRGAESAQRAFDLSARLSPEDRMSVEAQFHEATASWPKALALYRQLWTRYPDNVEYGLKLGHAQFLGGESKQALNTVAELRGLPERDSRDSRIDLLEAAAADSLADYARASAAAASAADKAIAGKARLLLAVTRLKQGIYAARVAKRDEAQKFFAEAEALFTAMGETGGVADALQWQGSVLFEAARYDEAATLFERALAMAAPLNYIRLATEIRISLAGMARLRGDLGQAAALAEDALASAREADNRSLQARALVIVGSSARLRNEFARAREMYQQSADIAGAIGEVRNQNIAVNYSAVLDFLTGDLDAARRKFEAVLAYDRKIGNKAGVTLRLNHLSRVLALQDALDAAEKLNVEECELQQSLKAAPDLAWCRTRLAEIVLERGRRSEAVALATHIAVADFGSGLAAPVFIARLARVQVALGQVAAAASTIAAAERVQIEAGIVEEQAIHVSVVRAEVEAAQGKRAAAIERLHRARIDADRLGLVMWSLDARMVLSRLDRREAAATTQAAHDAGFALIARKSRLLTASSS